MADTLVARVTGRESGQTPVEIQLVMSDTKAKALGLKNVRINNAGCLDRCELGPTLVIYPEGIWYRVPTKEDVDEVLDTHLVKGGRVERLMLKPEDK